MHVNQQTSLQIKNRNNFVGKFNSKFTNIQLFIACITLSELSNYNKNKLLKENDKFLGIASQIQSSEMSYRNVDSLIENYVNINSEMNFLTDSTMYNLITFMKSYDLSDLIFSEIDSDEQVEQMDILKEKIFKTDDLKKIYLLYMEDRPDLSSLSSNEGVALNIHLAYYLYIQSEINRKMILKNLL